MTRKLLTAAAATIALASASVHAAPADPLRAGAPVSGEELKGDGVLIAVLAAAVIGFVLIVSTEDDDDVFPTSP